MVYENRGTHKQNLINLVIRNISYLLQFILSHLYLLSSLPVVTSEWLHKGQKRGFFQNLNRSRIWYDIKIIRDCRISRSCHIHNQFAANS